MAVRIRLKRAGRRNRAFFRIAAMDSRSSRDGRVVEELGYYDPLAKDEASRVRIKRERVEYWLGVGAQPSESVRSLLKQSGLVMGPKK